ncbi:MAG: hypothetical protein BWX90_00749 [bacterium ADurb.Bin132]|nr:MAG: hypothetical protein BWX90_00749 [bacterium ADurb.Bin132]
MAIVGCLTTSGNGGIHETDIINFEVITSVVHAFAIDVFVWIVLAVVVGININFATW